MIQQLFNDSENLHNKNTYESDEDDTSDRIDIIKNEIEANPLFVPFSIYSGYVCKLHF